MTPRDKYYEGMNIPNSSRVSDKELANRSIMMADFDSVFIKTPRGRAVLSEIARILHFTVPAITQEDMALQNAFKSILHRLGRWSDDDVVADEIIGRLIGG